MISQRTESRRPLRDETVFQIDGRVKIDFRKLRGAASFNHALQRTGAACVAEVEVEETAAGVAAVTAAAANPQTCRQPPRQSRLLLARPSCGGGLRPRRSLSLRSLIWLCLSRIGKASLPTFFLVVVIV